MGTRNLTMVVYEGKARIAQYGQWDGYPEGSGVTIFNFLKRADLNRFKEKLKKAKFIDNDEEKQKEMDEFLDSIGSKDGWLTLDQSNEYKKRYPLLHRDLGADILNYIYDDNESDEFWTQDSTCFAGDGLFCEWAYVIDLDKNTFEIYNGFHKNPIPKNERFSHLASEQDRYGPVRHFLTFDLNELPESESEFLKVCNEKIET